MHNMEFWKKNLVFSDYVQRNTEGISYFQKKTKHMRNLKKKKEKKKRDMEHITTTKDTRSKLTLT